MDGPTLEEVVRWYDQVRARLPVVVLSSTQQIADAVDQRILEDGRTCARCLNPATQAAVGRNDDDADRWLDLCADCYLWVQSATD